MYRPKILVFASGTSTGGGSSFENLVKSSRSDRLKADIVGVVSNHQHGGVRKRAEALGVPFHFFPGPWTGKKYQRFVKKTRAKFVILAGWLKLAKGLDPKRTINIHPGPLPEYGGHKMYGHHVHEAVMEAFRAGKITYTEVSIHFVNKPREGKNDYDRGQVIFRWPVVINSDDTAETLAARVLTYEHQWLPIVAHWLVWGLINWSGKDGDKPQFWSEKYTYHEHRPPIIEPPEPPRRRFIQAATQTLTAVAA